MSSPRVRLATALATALAAALFAATSTPPPAGAKHVDFDLQAHRGGRGETTESSLRAFTKSLELGVSTLEFDVTLTKDRQPLVWHDPTIQPDKCADTAPAFNTDPQYPYVGKPVGELTLAQIRTLDCGQPLAEFPHAEVVRHNVIATLAEVFAATRGAEVRYDIEAKVGAESPAELVEVILAAVGAAGTLDRVEIASFDWRVLPLVRAAEPSIPLVALWDQSAVGDPLLGAVAVGADIASPSYELADRELIERAHALGLRVVSWTVNDAEAIRAQLGAGVDGIITDYPALACTVLHDLGLPLPPAVQHR